MFSSIQRFYHRNKCDQTDISILESIQKKVFSLKELADAVAKPGKIAFIAARLKNHEFKRKWIVTSEHPHSKRDKVRKLTRAGRIMLNRARAHAINVTCNGGDEDEE